MGGVFATVAEWLLFGQKISLCEALSSLAIFAGLLVVVTAPGRVGYVDTRQAWAAALSPSSGRHVSLSGEDVGHVGFPVAEGSEHADLPADAHRPEVVEARK